MGPTADLPQVRPAAGAVFLQNDARPAGDSGGIAGDRAFPSGEIDRGTRV